MKDDNLWRFIITCVRAVAVQIGCKDSTAK